VSIDDACKPRVAGGKFFHCGEQRGLRERGGFRHGVHVLRIEIFRWVTLQG
jgi:hypothetical protein